MNRRLVRRIQERYRGLHGHPPAVTARAPGRANIIGEHTDYNGGFVLPVGIDKNLYACGGARSDGDVHLYACDYEQATAFPLADFGADPAVPWANYQKGVVDELRKAGHTVGGFNLVFAGDVPLGAGLSSSAAVEMVTAVTLDALFGLGVDRLDMVRLCQRAEHGYPGVQCGIMDQFASGMARTGHAVLLDCNSLDYRYIPFAMDTYYLVLCNTLKQRELVDSEYNRRRRECEEGVRFFQKVDPGVGSLRDVGLDLFETHQAKLPEVIRRRCAHVIGENARVLDCVAALERNDYGAVKDLLFASHYSLKDLYEVSCAELDVLVEIAAETGLSCGSRMMGGGFGGCTINVVHRDTVKALSEALTRGYETKTGVTPEVYVCRIEDGAGVIAETG